jgi:glycosyltransferase involved in cell wall biosynthesis
MDDLISVIVPIYNIEKYLPKCLDSIYYQTYKNLDVLLVDDGSTDRSGLLCDEYAKKDSRCRVIHQSNQGLWAARNTGQNAAQGAFLFFPDGDDYFHYDMIRQMYAAISGGKNYDISIVGCKITEYLDESVSAPVNSDWEEYLQEDMVKTILSSNDYPYPNIWNKLFRKASVGDLRSRPYQRAQDLDFVLRFFLKNGKVVGTRQPLYFWVKHEGQISRAPDAWLSYCKIDTEICRSVLESLPGDNKYRGFLLDFMYRQMANWRMKTLGTIGQEEARGACNKLYSATAKEYWRNPVTPAIVKLIKFLSIRKPEIWAFVLRYLNGKQKEPFFMKALKKRGWVKITPSP